MPKQELIPEQQIQEIQKCATDPIYFIENYCYIKDHRSKKAIKFVLWPAQKEVLLEWFQNHYFCSLKARQVGITWLITVCCSLWQTIFFKYQEILIICTKEDKAISMLEDRIKFTFSLLPDWMKPKVCVDNLTEIRFGEKIQDKSGIKKIVGNNSAIKAETAGKNAGRSDTITQLILEEMAHIEEGLNDIILSAFPTVETCRGRIACISTAKGDVGYFRDIFWDGWNNRSSAVKEDDEMIFHSSFIPWSANPERNQKWYDKTKARPEYRSEGDFMQEFPSTPQEAFKSSGSPVFDQNVLHHWSKLASREEFKMKARGNIEWIEYDKKRDHRQFKEDVPDVDYGTRFVENREGFVRLFDYPEQRMSVNRYSISCDPASGEIDTGTGHKKDQTSITVWDRLLMRVACRVYSNKIDTMQAAEILWQLGVWYNFAPVIVERNNHGLAVLNELGRNYSNLYCEIVYERGNKNKRSKRAGFKTTGKRGGTRFLILARLQEFIKKDKGIVQCKEAIKQLRKFQKTFKETGEIWQAGPGADDDAVLDLALNFELQSTMSPIKRSIYGSRMNTVREKFKRKNKNTTKQSWEVI